MPALALLAEIAPPTTNQLTSTPGGRGRRRPRRPSTAVDGSSNSKNLSPLPPPVVKAGGAASKRRVVVDLLKPLGMALNADCSVSAVVPGGQVDMVHGITVG
jgi:hypothetical protein